jgi:hypothetical protein
MTSWKKLYFEVVVETNPKTLKKLMRRADTALFLRELDLANNPDADGERREIQNAASALQVLKTESLAWPVRRRRV